MRDYASSFIFSAFALGCGFYIGGWAGAWAILMLGILEVSLSFENAVVNASVLKNWGEVWRRRFMVWGMLIAVFGMRVVCPLLIVAVLGHMGPLEVIDMAMNKPEEYSQVLKSAHSQIVAFGGTFLLMVFLKFFLDNSKDVHWLKWIEHPMTKLARFTEVIVLSLLVAITMSLPAAEQSAFLIAGVCGLGIFLLVEVLGSLMGGDGEGHGSERVIKEGIGGFMYLEVLDASFSFDGVIGAFALSTNIFIIALGLGIGAMFVRSMTLVLVKNDTLGKFRYLQHGAFWAVGALALVMFISLKYHLPETVTGLAGAVAIGAALWSSVRANRREAALEAQVA